MKQSLKQALHLIKSEKSKYLDYASCVLSGKPVGGWPETRQAFRDLVDLLPSERARSYTVSDFVDAVYDVDNGHYRRKDI